MEGEGNMKSRKRWLRYGLILGLIVGFTFLLVSPATGPKEAAAASKTRISILTGGSGGVFYIIGAGMAKVVNQRIPSLEATAQATAATVENIELINAGKGDFATAIYDRVYMAYHGTDAYEGKPRPNLRLGLGGHFGAWHLVTLSDSSIKTPADMKGKKMAISPMRGAYEMMGHLVGPHGINKEDYKLIPMSYSEMVVALKDRTIDAGLFIAGTPVSSVVDLSTTHSIRFIKLTEEDVANFIKKVPCYYRFVIPANTYKGQTADYLTVAGAYILLVSSKVSDEIGYSVAKTILESTEDLIAIHPDGKYWGPKHPLYSEVPPKIPYHPGTARYLKEKGLIK
jgi:uncharacterized protein